MNRLTNKVAIVTGGAIGIGRACVHRMASEGAKVAIFDLLEAGDKVPADLRVLEARGLAVQEAILTGESVPVEKGSEPVAKDAALADRRSMLWSGTLGSNLTIAGAPALYVALSLGEKEEGRKLSLREFLSWSIPFTLICSTVCYILGMLIWVLPYTK